MTTPSRLPALFVSAALLAAALLLAAFFVLPGDGAAFEARGGIGPATWPRVMLLGISCCAAVVLLRELVRRRAPPPSTPEADASAAFDDRKLVIGIVLLLGFGIAVPVIGFALAMAAFLVLWLAFGGLRKPLSVLLTSVLGTAVLLYLFAGVSRMPFDRGIGVFDRITVALYRLLGIY